MNPLVNILSKIIMMINSSLDRIDRKKAESIKQGFIFLVFVLSVVTIIIGYRMGRDSVKRTGTPLIKGTKDLFEIDIKRERETPRYGGMIDSDALSEIKDIEYKKITFPSREGLNLEATEKLAEPEALKKKPVAPVDADTRERLSEIDRTDDSLPKGGVRPLKRRNMPEEEKNRPALVKDDERTLPKKDTPETVKKDVRDSAPRDIRDIEKGKKSDEKIRFHDKRDLKPIDKDKGTVQK